MELRFHSYFRQSTRITVPHLHGIGCISVESQNYSRFDFVIYSLKNYYIAILIMMRYKILGLILYVLCQFKKILLN